MSDHDPRVPVFWMPEPAKSAFKTASTSGKAVGGVDPWEYMNSELAQMRSALDNPMSQDAYGDTLALTILSAPGAAATGFVVAGLIGLGPVGWIAGAAGAVYNAFSSDKLAKIVIVNDTDYPLTLAHPLYQSCGELVAKPAEVISDSPLTFQNEDVVPARKTVGSNTAAGMGCYCFHKKKTLLIGFYGTAGTLVFQPIGGEQHSIGMSWQVPENGKNACAVAVDRAAGNQTSAENLLDLADNHDYAHHSAANTRFKVTGAVSDQDAVTATFVYYVEQL